MKQIFRELWREEEGQDLVEYGLLVALVALAAMAGMNSLASDVNAAFGRAGNALNTGS